MRVKRLVQKKEGIGRSEILPMGEDFNDGRKKGKRRGYLILKLTQQEMKRAVLLEK